jgi:hypothetical protein
MAQMNSVYVVPQDHDAAGSNWGVPGLVSSLQYLIQVVDVVLQVLIRVITLRGGAGVAPVSWWALGVALAPTPRAAAGLTLPLSRHRTTAQRRATDSDASY